MAHINNTLIKKRLASEAKDTNGDSVKYRKKVAQALDAGYPKESVIAELEREMNAIIAGQHKGDPIFLEGVHNAKVSCIAAIRTIIVELKGEHNGCHIQP